MEVVLFANFFWKWGNYPPCQSLWRGRCYALSGEFKFHVREQEVNDEEEDRFEKKWRDRIDVKKYREARPGDHVLAPFKFETCVFLKLKGRHALQVRNEDMLLCDTLRRCNLDVLEQGKIYGC